MSTKSHRHFCADAKKFSPKQHRQRVGAMSEKPCPLHDLERKRPCKQATNENDICPKFQPGRSRYAAYICTQSWLSITDARVCVASAGAWAQPHLRRLRRCAMMARMPGRGAGGQQSPCQVSLVPVGVPGMLQEGRRCRPAGGAQADRSAGSRRQEAAQEARKEVSNLPGCVALGACHGQPMHTGFAIVGIAGRAPGMGRDQIPWGCCALVVTHSVPYWCCHVTWAVGGVTVELWA